jgi:hypothetical protein
MSKREKIILFAMVLAILYGGYKLFYTPYSDTGIESHKQKTDKFIIARAKEAWAGDPFLKIGLPVASEVKQERVQASTPNMSFKYSGYMEMGRQRLAVINGMEYVVGDELEPGGYIVNSISASQVVIGIKNTNQNIILPADKMN